MADDLTPGHVSTRRFDVVRKGYDRTQVEQFLASVDDELTRLTSELQAASGAGVAIGIDEQEALAQELHTIGAQVGEILEAARAAAEGMRTRASDDASAWRSEAESESATLLADAHEQSQSMRAAAWNEGSSLLSSAVAEAQALVAAAKEESLFIRAEAEREAIRLTGDAKRDREEVIRSARQEADQIVESARQESDGVLAAASQQAELAQERARALEDRRSELLSELEATRASISELETEIESRRQALEEPEEPELPEEEPNERSHHASDGGSVRIVAPTRAVSLKPVDAEELVAEVEALRASDMSEPDVTDIEPTPAVVEAVPPIEAEPVAVEPSPAPMTSRPEPAPTPEPEVSTQTTPEITEPAPTSVEAESPDEPPVAREADDVPSASTPPIEEDDQDEALDDEPVDELGSLFAQLRETASETTPVQSVVAEPEEPASASVSDIAVEAEEPESEPTPAQPPAAAGPEESGDAGADPATVIPLQNTALRAIKRTLVDLQNETLDHLRTDADWVPDEEYTDRFGGPFDDLTEALSGSAQPDVAAAFATDLYDAVSSAVERARDGGGGEREIAAAASKVFRTWRSDEAERRVVAVTESSVG